MKKAYFLSLACASAIFAQEMETIIVKEKINTKIVKDVSAEELKSADLAESLMKSSPSIDMIRRSGIANDIVIRGQKRDNINVLIDGAKIYGACPNRMDPPTSHVLTNNIEKVIVKEGAFDVENFGTLSALVEVKTKEPKKGVNGEINLNAGSFGYKKASATISGGTKNIKGLLSISHEESEQYKDGDGKTLSEQVDAKAPTTFADATKDYRYKYKNMDAYEKKTLMGKLYFNLTDNQQIKLSYTANRSDNILYPNTPMDAIKDDSDIYGFTYSAKELSSLSKELVFDMYYSKVDHPMATNFRNNGAMQMTNNMESSIKGAKVKNTLSIKDALLTFGIDSSIRTWEGFYSNKSNPFIADSISKTDTTNKAVFAKYEDRYSKLDVEYALRYDNSEIDTKVGNDRDFNSVNGYVFATYNVDKDSKYFVGLGKSSRVPDARELYFKKSGNHIGTPTLNEISNYEIDLGFEKRVGDFKIKTKTFYSILKDYIAFNNSAGTSNKFENVDAKIYGIEVSGFYYLTDEMSIDYATTYKRGKKDNPLTNQTDKDLADISPLKATIGFTYEDDRHTFNAKVIASDSWKNIDSDNKEQELDSYAILNLKYNNQVTKNFDVTFGVDNVFDKTYALSNTYADLTLVTSGAGEKVLINEPGRYGYINLRYKF